MRDAFIEELTKLALEDKNFILITGDLGFGVFDDFAERFPSQYLNVGVAEQNMTMVAAGIAMTGKKVYTYSIGNFPTLRCLEQIRNDICYHNLNVTIVCIGGGFSYGQLGMSHHATEDLSIMRSIPNIQVASPCSIEETKKITNYLHTSEGPSYLRLDKSKAHFELINFKFGKMHQVQDGKDLTLLATGGILGEALTAAKYLSKYNILCRVLSVHSLKPLDTLSVSKAVQETGGLVTIEENNIIGGLGGAISEYCMENNMFPKKFLRIGLDDSYSNVVGDQEYLRQYYNMDSDNIAKRIKNLLNL